MVIVLRCHLVYLEGNLSLKLRFFIREVMELLLLLWNWLVSLLHFLVCIVIVLLGLMLLLLVRLLGDLGITLVAVLDGTML